MTRKEFFNEYYDIDYWEDLPPLANKVFDHIEELEAKLKKYEEPVAEFEGRGTFKEIYFEDDLLNTHEVVTNEDTNNKSYKVIIIEADK